MDVQTEVPGAIKKQGEAADALHRKLYPDQYPADGEQTQGKDPAQDAAKPGDGKPAEPAKPGEPAKEVPKEAPKEAAPEDWKQKYDTLQGKYNAEVPGLHQTVAAFKNQLTEAGMKITALEAEVKAAVGQGKAAEKEKDNGKGAGEEEIADPELKAFSEEYPDIFTAMKKLIGQKPKEAAPKEPAKPAEPKPAPTPDTNVRATFTYYLNRDMPDWRQVNVDPDFINSLSVQDPNSPGHTKLESIQAAYDAADFTTVLGFFRDFKASKAIPSAAKLAEDTAGKPAAELSEQEKALNPPKGNRAPTGATTASTVTPEQLTKFYDEGRRGLWGPITGEKFRVEEARLLAALKTKT